MNVNSYGGHVTPTISADEYKGAQAQKDHGVGVCRRTVRAFNFELFANTPAEAIGTLCASRYQDWIVYEKGDAG